MGMNMTDNTNLIQRQYEYNTLTGKWQRVEVTNDFQQIAGRTGSAGTTEVVITSGTPTANKDLYATTVSFSNQTGTACTFAVSNNNSTIMYELVAAGANYTLNGGANPLFKVGNTNTVALVVVNPTANGTYSAFMTANRCSIDSKIEP